MFSKMESQRKRPPDRLESDRIICRPFTGLILSASDIKQPIVQDETVGMEASQWCQHRMPSLGHLMIRLKLKLIPIPVRQNVQFSRSRQKKNQMRENAKVVYTNAILTEVKKRFRAFHTGKKSL